LVNASQKGKQGGGLGDTKIPPPKGVKTPAPVEEKRQGARVPKKGFQKRVQARKGVFFFKVDGGGNWGKGLPWGEGGSKKS